MSYYVTAVLWILNGYKMYFPGITLANVLSVDGRWTQIKQLSDGAVRGMAVPLGIGVAVHEIWMFFFCCCFVFFIVCVRGMSMLVYSWYEQTQKKQLPLGYSSVCWLLAIIFIALQESIVVRHLTPFPTLFDFLINRHQPDNHMHIGLPNHR